MSHHYSGPNIRFPRGDARLNLTDLYAFPKPGDPGKSILIMNVHPSVGFNPPGPTTSEPFAPEARYELRIHTDGDAVANISYKVRFAPVEGGEQTATQRRVEGAQTAETGGGKVIVEGVPVSTGHEGHVTQAGDHWFFAGCPFSRASRTTLTSPGSQRTMHVSFLSSRTLRNTQAGIHRKKQSGWLENCCRTFCATTPNVPRPFRTTGAGSSMTFLMSSSLFSPTGRCLTTIFLMSFPTWAHRTLSEANKRGRQDYWKNTLFIVSTVRHRSAAQGPELQAS